ncbi:MAG: hypothetical protein A3C44_05035 [Gammaproteobacteria bacterium RIFCSPHIGHO2_02_FULL_39_13]|nr:MAG: hypothetical protein A3C44_05035 [Gammaproteobacteria bacterium RIFCSPHIGHO2_02_FULL_39_13]OGT50562.1 MAG: hypothetical protein A3E53_03470 [Gammaproteobacteria bacterium RIFCSPHIGHO2_12_FULL_39_24]
MRSVEPKKSSSLVKLYLLPPIAKMLIALFIFLFIATIGTLYLKYDAAQQLKQSKEKKAALESELTVRAKEYGELVYFSKDVVHAKQEYEDMIKSFPPGTKIEELLSGITKLGTADGLKFIYFKPGVTENHIYYASIAVDISVIGSFHQLGRFLSGIANLPNSVVAINQFSISHYEQAGVPKNLLLLTFTATLYHTLPTSLEIKT